MNAKEFTKGKDYTSSKGFPQGKTLIDLATADFGETTFTEPDGTAKIVNQVKIGEETFNVPKSVMQKIQEATEKKASGVEVNREGTTRNDTKYVTYLLDDAGKVIQE